MRRLCKKLLTGWTRIRSEKDEFESKQKELEGIVNPIMMKVYQAAGGGGDMPDGGMPGGMGGNAPPGTGAGGPTVEEVD